MKYPLAAFGVIAIVITGFVLLFTNYSQSASSELTEKITKTETIDDCYDQSLNSWFLEFTASQENGATMSEADENASQAALDDLGQCLATR